MNIERKEIKFGTVDYVRERPETKFGDNRINEFAVSRSS